MSRRTAFARVRQGLRRGRTLVGMRADLHSAKIHSWNAFEHPGRV